MSANNGTIEGEPMQQEPQEQSYPMRGYFYLGPDETYEPTQSLVSTISSDHVVHGKRTRRSVERFEPSSVKSQRRRTGLSLGHEHKLEETASQTLVLHSNKLSKETSIKISQNMAVCALFPDLPKAKNCSVKDSNLETKYSDKKLPRLEPVTIIDGSSRSHGEGTIKAIASDSPLNDDSKDREKLSRLTRDLAQKQEEAKLHAREIRILKRQVRLLLAQSDDMTDLKVDLDDVRTQNEELQRQINQTNGSTRRGSKVHTGEVEKLQTQARTIQQLKSRLDKASQLNQLFLNPSLHDWARKPTDGKGGLLKIRTSIILLASSLEQILLVPEDLEKSLEIHERGQATVDLLMKSFGNTQLLFSEPWPALRSLLFRFIRDYIFYSDLWQTFHCDGFIARQYQRVIGLSAPDGYLELFHKTAFDEILHDTNFKEYVLRPHMREVKEELMHLLAPLIDTAKMNEEIKNIESQANTLVEYAFTLRASCIPEPGERFEVTHYTPGEIFDPDTMRPENTDGREMVLPETHDILYRVKVCVHGSLKKYVVEERAKGADLLKIMGQPFLDYAEVHSLRGSLISEKACVVLETSHR